MENFLITKDKCYSRLETLKKIKEVTGFFKSNGFKKNDKLIIQRSNKVDSIFLYLACLKNQITFIPVDHNAPEEYIMNITQTLNQEAIITDTDNIYGKEVDLEDSIDLNAVACILFSSGSTNNPKAIQLTHLNIQTQMDSFKREFNLNEKSVISNFLPIYYTDGIFQGPIMAYFNSCSFIVSEEFNIKKTVDLLEAAKENNSTHIIMSPILLKIIESFEDFTKPFFREYSPVIISTSDKLNIELWTKLVKEFYLKIISIYGLTETVSGVFFTRIGFSEIGSIGSKPEDCQVKIVDNELWIKSDHISPGYLNNELETAATFENGWLKTGDLAYKKNDLFFINGRKKNLIVSAGYAIYPEEINEVLKTNKEIKDSAVFGREDSIKGEIICAAIVSSATEAEINSFLEKNLVKYKIPTEIYFIDQIPKTPTGKISYSKIKEQI